MMKPRNLLRSSTSSSSLPRRPSSPTTACWMISLLWVVLFHSARVVNGQQGSYAALFEGSEEKTLRGKYIVVFQDEASDSDVEETLARTLFDRIRGVVQEIRYRNALNAVSLQFSDDEEYGEGFEEENDWDSVHATHAMQRRNDVKKLELLRQSPMVKYIQEVQEGQYSVAGNQAAPPSFGVDRIDQANLPLNNAYRYEYTGDGVDVYVLDSGILSGHQDMKKRVKCGLNTVEGKEECDDVAGHGTFVAGVVGGTLYGVAKEVNLINVKVGDKKAPSSEGMLAGLDYVVGEIKKGDGKPVVVNISLDFPKDAALNDAANNAAKAGAVVVVAAGNENDDACLYSPASANKVLTVASIDRDDTRSSFSNYGDCVDLFAPGEDIVSAGTDSTNDQTRMSGTSFSSPHVAGVAALYITSYPKLSAKEIAKKILADATEGVVADTNGSPNVLVSTVKLDAQKQAGEEPESGTGPGRGGGIRGNTIAPIRTLPPLDEGDTDGDDLQVNPPCVLGKKIRRLCN